MADIVFGYEPLEIHRPFHRSSARYACMFGAVGSGKSYALVSEGIARCLETPGLRALLGRKNVSNLKDTTETIFFDILPLELFHAGTVKKLGGHVDRFTFPNGSEMLFRGLENWEKHKSLNLGWIGIDEADELDADTMRGMNTRLRQVELTQAAKEIGYTHKIPSNQFRLATNCAGKNWIYDIFVDQHKLWKDSAWFRSTSFDNPYLQADFLDSLLDMPEQWIKRYVLAQFDDFAGSIYPTWTWGTHVIPVRTDPWPTSTQYFQWMDPGISQTNPCASIWAVLDPETRRLVAIHEYQEPDRSIKEHAEAWRKIEAKLGIRHVSWRVADPAVESRDFATNMSRSDMFRRHGYSFDIGAKNHTVRIPALGELIWNNQFVAQENCPQLHDQITRYRWADLSPAQRNQGMEQAEKVRKGNDHLVDCAQYGAARYRAPARPTAPKLDLTPEQEFAQEIHRTMKMQLAGRRAPQPLPPGVIL